MRYAIRAGAGVLTLLLYPASQASAASINQDVYCSISDICQPVRGFDNSLGNLRSVSFTGEVTFSASYILLNSNPDPTMPPPSGTVGVTSAVDFSVSILGTGSSWNLTGSSSETQYYDKPYLTNFLVAGGALGLNATTTSVVGFIGSTPVSFTPQGILSTTLTEDGVRLESYPTRGDGPKVAGVFSYEYDEFSAAVPEPSSWALLISGFGMIGGCARRRSRKPAIA